MRCCEAWEPVVKCFDPIPFECTDFQGLSQIIASLTRENLTEREAQIGNLPWTQTEKDNALAKCRLGLRARHGKRPVLSLHAVSDEDVILRKTKKNQAGGFVNIGVQSLGMFKKLLTTLTTSDG